MTNLHWKLKVLVHFIYIVWPGLYRRTGSEFEINWKVFSHRMVICRYISWYIVLLPLCRIDRISSSGCYKDDDTGRLQRFWNKMDCWGPESDSCCWGHRLDWTGLDLRKETLVSPVDKWTSFVFVLSEWHLETQQLWSKYIWFLIKPESECRTVCYRTVGLH